MPTTRVASCCCGSLRAETEGESAGVAVCHCGECQRRTGSAFGANTYFRKEQVRTERIAKAYVRDPKRSEGQPLRRLAARYAKHAANFLTMRKRAATRLSYTLMNP